MLPYTKLGTEYVICKSYMLDKLTFTNINSPILIHSYFKCKISPIF